MQNHVKQHGIFFTDSNLAKFALWFAHKNLPAFEQVADLNKFIFFDPAAGIGNLLSAWQLKINYLIACELQTDFIEILQKKIHSDKQPSESSFAIIPSQGINFIDKSAQNYIQLIENELNKFNLQLNKPFAFFVNPPYKNTDENKEVRTSNESDYDIHPSIIQITGDDAVKERYLAFLGQILNICKLISYQNHTVMIFTPTSWLIPRSTFSAFRAEWDKYFEYVDGFICTSKEFFNLSAKWPLAFTIWQFNYNPHRQNKITINDYTYLKTNDLEIDWELEWKQISEKITPLLGDSTKIKFDISRGDIRHTIPEIQKGKKRISQPRFNMYRNLHHSEREQTIVSGFPLNDLRHTQLKVPYGFSNGSFVGFMDDNTPVRLKQDSCQRMSKKPDRVWFMLMSACSKLNASQAHSGAANSRSFCAYNLPSAKVLFTWFSVSKALINRYPLWANQYNVWKISPKPETQAYFHSLCFAFVLAENRCVVTKFEKDNPVVGAPEIFVDNPLCPTHPESFWAKVLDGEVSVNHTLAYQLVEKIKQLYRTWNTNYCKGQFLHHVGLKTEPYFKYFDYPDFLTPYSGLIQIKKYAQQTTDNQLEQHFAEITELSKKVKDQISQMLINDYGYFD